MDPLETQGGPTLLRGTKRPRATTEFSVLMEQLRSMADFLPQTVSDDDLAQDMGARIAMLAQGVRQLEQATRDQGGLQIVEAIRAVQGNRDWLTSNWLYTVASLLEEGDTLALELQHVRTDAHGSDV